MMKNCECGCGGEIAVGVTKYGTPRRFLPNHNARLTGSKAPHWTEIASKRPDGYLVRHDELEHRRIASSVLGYPLDPVHPVHHHDENRSNNTHSNLVICEDRAYHNLLHARMRVLKAGGDPNTEQFCQSCKTLKPLSEFNKNKIRTNGFNKQCKPCKRKQRRAVVDRLEETILDNAANTDISGMAIED